jgi:peptide/nickel transport system substrate-binding protein
VVDGQGTEIRYLTFDVKNTPADNKAVRQAVAQVIDREAIAKQVYNDTVTPMYSMIPAGVGAHSDSFKQKYGAPSKEKAQGILTAAGVTGPVALTLWYTPSHYGPATVDEFTEIKRQLEASGLFKVELKTTEWEEYQKAFKAGQYASYGVGWFPDFPDADNFTAPFLFKGGYFKNHYENPALDELITKTQGLTDRKAAESSFAEIQKITAEDVPVLPVWQGKQIGAVQKGITGLDKTLDPTYIIRLWMIGTGGK